MSNAGIANVDLRGYEPSQRALLEGALEAMEGMGWDRDRICQIAQRTWGTITRFVQGKPQGDQAAVIADLARVGNRSRTELVMTPVVQDYWRVLKAVRKGGGMGAVVARNGRGKTMAMDAFSRQSGDLVRRIQVPSRCTWWDLVRVILDGMGVESGTLRQGERARVLQQTVTPRHTLLIDEAGYLVQSNRKASGLRLLQDLSDNQGCGVVLSMRPTQWLELVQGRSNREDEQLLGRVVHRSILVAEDDKSDGYKREEVEMIMAPFCGDMDKGTRKLVRDLLAHEIGGLRALVHDARTAAEFAAGTGVPFAQAFAEAVTLRNKSGHVLALEDF